jgi:endogenous inhibitor of DNA gyrase (YacG/DUF329 family)
MTTLQKQQIKYMRGKGDSYAVIAAELGISENTVKSFCRRNNLGAGVKIEPPAQTTEFCETCGNPLIHTTGSKRKRFCSDKCRLLWWNDHPECINRKAVYNFTCSHCNAEFSTYGNKERKYCSHACYTADRFGKGAVV